MKNNYRETFYQFFINILLFILILKYPVISLLTVIESDHSSWLDCIGQLFQRNRDPMEADHFVYKIHINQNDDFNFNIEKYQSSDVMKIVQQNILDTEEYYKRPRQVLQIDHHYEIQNSFQNSQKQQQSDLKLQSQEKQNPKKLKNEKKQHIYSKNYRQRKKQQIKKLEEENQFLKKKINQLQHRLRQMQHQVNRLKNPVQQNEMSVEELNQYFVKKVSLLVQKTQIAGSTYVQMDKNNSFYEQFIKSYDELGFGGSKKIKLLNYYFDQILQATVRDSQKYFCLVCNRNEDGYFIEDFSSYKNINSIFFQIIQWDQDKDKRLKFFSLNLQPIMVQLKASMSKFYKGFIDTLNTIDKVHQFMKQNYPQNMDFSRKRIEIQNWFDKHKYGKQMRQLRAQWLQMIKTYEEPIESEEKVKKIIGNKKKNLKQNKQK